MMAIKGGFCDQAGEAFAEEPADRIRPSPPNSFPDGEQTPAKEDATIIELIN